MPVTPKYPVAHPTWYDTIRLMFTKTDIEHMNWHELDLTSYEQVSGASGNIYGNVAAQNMPPGNPWTADMVQTFLNWMNDNCPKGTPAPDQVSAAMSLAKTAAARIRKDVNSLSDPEKAAVKKAFEGIMAKNPSDSNSYFAQAGIHWLPDRLCQHHVPAYNPWHRGYLLGFENALRSVSGCENVTVPYWDITTPFPDFLKSPPFDKYTLPQDIGPPPFTKGYVTERSSYPDIQSNLQFYDVTGKVNRALTKTDWEDFNGWWSGAPHNTIIQAHDDGHGSIGPTMANQSVASFDPVFWFFHANWDRLWWQWQVKVQATNLNGLLSTIDKTTDSLSYQIFTVPALQTLMMKPFAAAPLNLDTVKVIDSVNSLGVDYAPPATGAQPLAFALKTSRAVSVDREVSVNPQRAMVSVAGINRLKIPGSFAVHLMKDGKRIASSFMFQPDEPEKCETCAKNAIAQFDFDLPLAEISGGKLSVDVEPVNKDVVGPRFPAKLMGNPMIDVHIPLQTD